MEIARSNKSKILYRIYILVDPRPNRIECYVGQTSKTLNERFRQHLSSKNGTTQKLAWLNDLARNNLKPEIYLLEAIDATSNKNIKTADKNG